MTPLDYAKLCCDAIIDKFEAPDLPPKGSFHYHAGVFLSGMERVYLATGDKKYEDYIRGFLDDHIDEEGNIPRQNINTLDDMQSCTLLIRMEKDYPHYKKALDKQVPRLFEWGVNPLGGFWHMKDLFKDEMWLDSIYMVGPLGVRYGLLRNDRRFIELIHTQLKVMWENMRDEKTGLLYHAWDYNKKVEWANPETGLSPNFWGRALGWYAVASSDMSEYLEGDELQKDFSEYAVTLVKSLLKYQDKETGLWYQVVDRIDDPENWTETSCSCLYLYALSNLIRRGLLGKEYVDCAKRAYEGIINLKTHMEGENLIISDICIGTGVGDYQHYLNRPKTENDLHGTGAFTLMCTEYDKMLKSLEI